MLHREWTLLRGFSGGHSGEELQGFLIKDVRATVDFAADIFVVSIKVEVGINRIEPVEPKHSSILTS